MTKTSFFLEWTVGLLFLTFISASPALAANFHVTDATGFQNALSTAKNNGKDDVIYLAAGTYYGPFEYIPPETEHKSLTIQGEAGTSAKDIILDGQNSSRVLNIADSIVPGSVRAPLANLVIDGITVQNGYSESPGGGIRVEVNGYNISITHCIIRSNRGGGNGGGVMMENTDYTAGVLTLENNLITDNTVTSTASWARAFGGGGYIYNGYGVHVIRNNIVAWNTAEGISPRGGGLWIGQWEGRLVHLIGNTIYDNQAVQGGGLYIPFGEVVNAYNNIVYGNTASEGGDMYLRNVDSNNGHSNNYSSMFGTWTTSSGNLNTNPLFVDPVNGDFHVQSGSPMINAGTAVVPFPPGLPSTDFDGNPRACGPAPDIGAYETLEFYPGQGTVGTEVSIPGSGYGTRRNKVLLDTTSLKILEWTETLIRGSITKALPPGIYDITIQPKGASSIVLENVFSVEAPQIDSIEPASGSTNDEIVIGGQFFGNKKGKVTLGGKNCRIKTWTMKASTGASEVLFVVPRGLSAGPHELSITNGVGSDTATFIVE